MKGKVEGGKFNVDRLVFGVENLAGIKDCEPLYATSLGGHWKVGMPLAGAVTC